MDLDCQTMEIKQEVETNCLKSIKDEPTENCSEFDCVADPLEDVKLEDNAAVHIKSEESETCTIMSEEEDTPDLIQIKTEKIAASDLELDSAMKKKNYARELTNSEAERNLYICYNCSYKTDCKNTLINHIASENCTSKTEVNKSGFNHTKRRQCIGFVCKGCQKQFKSKVGLDNHIIQRHTKLIALVKSKIHACTSCHYKTVYATHFKRHMWKHTDILPSNDSNRSRKSVFGRTDSNQGNDCTYCYKSFKNRVSLDGHIFQAHPEFIASVSSKIHACKRCNYKTIHQHHLKRHMWKHADVSLVKHKCCIQCNKVFNTKILWDEHILRKHPKLVALVTSKIHQCTVCDFRSTNRTAHNQHMLLHTDEVDQFSVCKYCNAKFDCKPSLLDHISKEHLEGIGSDSYAIYECTRCDYKTGHKNRLEMHMSCMHPSEVSVSCKYCNATIKGKRYLNIHVSWKHPDRIPKNSIKYECENCTYKCNIKRKLVKHMIIHHNLPVAREKIHTCLKCPYKTCRKDYLAKHILLHHDTDSNISICTQCKALFNDKQSLGEHIIKDHPNFIASIPCKVFECIYCSYKTTFSNSFKYHMMKHTGNLYACPHCDESFKKNRFREDHYLRKHPNFVSSITGRIHQCVHCNYKTLFKSTIQKHMTTHSDIHLSDKSIVIRRLR